MTALILQKKWFHKVIYLASLSLCLSFYNATVLAADNARAGVVVAVRGDVTAANDFGARVLIRGADIFTGDTITTGPTGFVQIRLEDSAIVALRADTVFEITEYRFNPASGQKDRGTMKVLQGGFTTITESIENRDRQLTRYTPSTDIDIRRTSHEGHYPRRSRHWRL